LLDIVLEEYPHLRDEIGKSTEADIRAKVLNAILKNIDESKKPLELVDTKTGKRIPDRRDKIVALESLDKDTRRNFNGRNSSNLFKATEVGKMPRQWTYVIKIGDPPSGHSGYDRVIGYSEERLSVGQSLKQLLGQKTRRPDYVYMRSEIIKPQLSAIKQGDDMVPRFREILDAASGKKKSQHWKSGQKVQMRNAAYKSIDFNTFITGETASNHVNKHTETVSKLVASQYEEGAELTGRVRVMVREWYHDSPSVFERDGRAAYGLRFKGSHTIYLSFDAGRNGKIGKWLIIPSTVGSEKFIDDFTRQASKLRKQLRAVINRVGRPR
jgi:hypothetical protein